MTAWGVFAGFTVVLTLALLVLTRLTHSALEPTDRSARNRPHTSQVSEPTARTERASTARADDTATARRSGGTTRETAVETPDSNDDLDLSSLSTTELLANVTVSQGLFGALLLGGAVYFEIPAGALGIEFTSGYLVAGITLGVGCGIVLAIGNELASTLAERSGFDHDEALRELLAPETTRGWVGLLVVVLPVIAVFEELLFRAALIGVLSAGFDVSPWLLVVVSSAAFALGHGIQGSVGIVVTGLLGLVLGATFILTGNLLVVVVAHYLVNAVEFVLHEGLDGAPSRPEIPGS